MSLNYSNHQGLHRVRKAVSEINCSIYSLQRIFVSCLCVKCLLVAQTKYEYKQDDSPGTLNAGSNDNFMRRRLDEKECFKLFIPSNLSN